LSSIFCVATRIKEEKHKKKTLSSRLCGQVVGPPKKKKKKKKTLFARLGLRHL
jgi:hypothetical protein